MKPQKFYDINAYDSWANLRQEYFRNAELFHTDIFEAISVARKMIKENEDYVAVVIELQDGHWKQIYFRKNGRIFRLK